jgi:hypothetical protein
MRLNCIDFGIDPPVPAMYASIASPSFICNGPNCVYLNITLPLHDNCLDVSSSSPWCFLCACSSTNIATCTLTSAAQLSSTQLLRLKQCALKSSATSTSTQRVIIYMSSLLVSTSVTPSALQCRYGSGRC